jgi:hypothetical protein
MLSANFDSSFPDLGRLSLVRKERKSEACNSHMTALGGDRRCFLFRGIKARNPTISFAIKVDLRLFVQNRVPVQEGPMFCLQLLTTVSVGGPTCLDDFRATPLWERTFALYALNVSEGRRKGQ